MRIRGFWLVLGMAAAAAAGAAVVYKWIDADGVVHYSDQQAPGAEKIITSSGSANGIGGAVRSQGARPAPKPANHTAFSLFAIQSPAKEQVFFGDEPIAVRLGVEPGLQPNQQLSWKLNGEALADRGPADISFVLPTLARGTYTISATVTDPGTGETRTTDSVTFYVRQPSELDTLRRK
jgi:hypothetical protein